MSSRREQQVLDGWPEEAPEGSEPAFQDSDSGRVTLSLDGPPLALPEDLTQAADAVRRRSSLPEPQHLDAWNIDRLRRSSLPPSAAAAVLPSTLPPATGSALRSEADLEEGDLWELVGRAQPSQTLDLVTEMGERFALGDFSGALRAAELLLGRDPDHPLAAHYARGSRAKLEELYISRLSVGELKVSVAASDLAWLGLDPQVTVLLSQIRDHPDYEQLLTHCGLPRLWALRALVDLLDAQVIRLV